MGKSSLKKSAPECPFECGGGGGKLPFGQCPHGGGDKLKGASLNLNHDFYFDENYAHRQDGGEYICTASNRVGPEAEAKLLLVISCKISQ